jgi:hypothetical protein
MATAPTGSSEPDFGPNVVVFDETMGINEISSKINPSNWTYLRDASEFGPGRYAYLFKPGTYNLIANVGYYTTVHGLGRCPKDITINGNVQSLATRSDGLALNNFWRGVENLTVVPPTGPPNIMTWAISQATWLRRVYVKGSLFLWDYRYDNQGGNFASGGFVADCVVDGTGKRPEDKAVIGGTQQQFITRNSTLTS